jgi:hypothetical protein
MLNPILPIFLIQVLHGSGSVVGVVEGIAQIALGHEPRIEPWLPLKQPVSIAALSNSIASSPGQPNSREWTTSQTSPEKWNYSGLDLEKEPRHSGRGGVFSLTSRFIELIDI